MQDLVLAKCLFTHPFSLTLHRLLLLFILNRQEFAAPFKAIAVAGLAALLISADAPAFAKGAPAATGPAQGEVLEQLLKQQKEGKSE